VQSPRHSALSRPGARCRRQSAAHPAEGGRPDERRGEELARVESMERKLKISDVTRYTGINRGTLTRLYHETAERVKLEVLDQLCTYFEIDLPELIERTAPEPAVSLKKTSAAQGR
jgi:putative transcriptional regulator